MTLQQSQTILIVDDKPHDVNPLCELLSSHHFQVIVVTHKEDAMKHLEAQRPHLILLDFAIGEQCHFEFVRHCKMQVHYQDIPIILIKQLDEPIDFTLGFSDFIVKPYQAEELLMRIHAQIALQTCRHKLQVQEAQVAVLSRKLTEFEQTHHQQIQQLNDAYRRFVPQEFLKFLGRDSVMELQLGDLVEREMTVMFSDIRGFSELSENMTPEEKFDFINIYLGQMEPIIGQHHGFVDKYIGDGIMALFPSSPDDALNACLAMLRKLIEYNELLHEAGYPSISIVIGVNTGLLMLGTVGGKNRMDGTVIADAVSVAARIEDLSKTYGTSLLITEHTLNKLQHPDKYKIRMVDRVHLKGKKESVIVYELFDADAPQTLALKLQTTADFEEACLAYHEKEYKKAQQLFEKIVEVNPHDKAAIVYLERCKTPEEVEAARAKFTTELYELNKAYERFVPREFLKLLDKESVLEVQLGDHVEREMTILFSDIRGFTAMSEKMTPQENFDFINIYLGQMEPIIGQHHGFVDKYIGDAIMALFPSSPDDAVRGAIEMLRGLVEYNELLKEAHYQLIRIGIGLNTGPLMLGTVGGPNRMDGTVISDAVNLAARIEGLTKIYGTALLITDQTYQKLEDISQYNIRVIDRVTVKGKTEPVTVYEVFDGDPLHLIELKSQTLNDFEEGCVYYHGQELDMARQSFEKVLAINPEDEAARVYLTRCDEPSSS